MNFRKFPFLFRLSSASRLSLAVAFLALLALAEPASAAPHLWIGSSASGFWSDPANWDTGVVPNDAYDHAGFTQTSALTVDLGGNSYAISSLTGDFSGDLEVTNGTLVPGGNARYLTNTGALTISADMLLNGTREFAQDNSAGAGGILLSGNISGTGGLEFFSRANSGITLSGNNTFEDGVQVGASSFYTYFGSDTALGTGDLTLGVGATSKAYVSALGTAARTFDNGLSLNARVNYLGEATTNTGKLTFEKAATLGSSSLIPTYGTAIKADSDVVLAAGLQSGAAANSNVIINSTSSSGFLGTVTLGATSDRTGETYIGLSSLYGSVRVTADNALGSGDIVMAGEGTGLLILEGGVQLDNTILSTSHNSNAIFLSSTSGDNKITGAVKITSDAATVGNQVEVVQDTLTLSGGVTGKPSETEGTLEKMGAGALVLTGTTDSTVRDYLITNGTVRVNSNSFNLDKRVRFNATGADVAVLETSGTLSNTISNTPGSILFDTPSANGGFAAHGGTLAVQLNGGAGSLTWGSSDFVDTGRLVLNSLTANDEVDFQNGLDLNGASRTVQVLDNPNVSTDRAKISGVISGGAGSELVKTGAGVLELTNANTYLGGTTVSAGTLLVNNASGSGSGSGAVTVNAGATLGGSGTIAGATTISGFHAPGNSPGIQTFGSDLSYTDLASVQWQLNANTTTQGSPTAVYDQIVVGGDLDFDGTVALTLDFTDAGSNVDWTNAFWNTDQMWTIYDVTGTTTDFASLDLTTINWADSLSQMFNTERAGSGFSLSQSGNDILLNYNVVPEPTSTALLLGAVGVMLVRFLRRVRRV